MDQNNAITALSEVWTVGKEFIRNHPDINDLGKIISTGSVQYCDLFCREINHKLNSRIIHLQGHRNKLPNRHKAHFRQSNPSTEFYHAMCLVEESFVVDPTAKLLNTTGFGLNIITTEELNAEWLMISSNYSALETFNNIETFLKQSSKKWQAQQYPDFKESELIELTKENKYLSQLCFSITIKNIKENHLVFTQIQNEENPLLTKLKEYKVQN